MVPAGVVSRGNSILFIGPRIISLVLVVFNSMSFFNDQAKRLWTRLLVCCSSDLFDEVLGDTVEKPSDDVSLNVVSNGTHAAFITSAGLRLCRPWCTQKMRPLSKFRNS